MGKGGQGTVNELTKLPTGFVDDFKLRPNVNKVFEEVEKAATRARAEKIEVSLEDLGASLATKIKEDLETWLPDAARWVLEEPLNKKPMQIPEMPLPRALEDLVGDLLQKADEFDEEADDITSAWGDNLDQAGLREKAEQVARKLETYGITSRQLNQSLELMRSVEQDLRDQRYEDAARKRRTALGEMKSAFRELDQSTATQLNRARDLPLQLRQELRQAADEAYSAGYETLLKSYYKALSQGEK